MAEPAGGANGYVLLLRRAGRPAGLRVHEVSEIRRLQQPDCQPAAQPLRYVKALTADMITVIGAQALIEEAISA
jgi:chemotaxis signal transduction protein